MAIQLRRLCLSYHMRQAEHNQYTLSEVLRPRSSYFFIYSHFSVFTYSQLVILGMRQNSKHGIHLCFIYNLYKYPEDNYIFLNVPTFWILLITWNQVWNFPFVTSCQYSKSFGFGILWGFRFGVREAKTVLSLQEAI